MRRLVRRLIRGEGGQGIVEFLIVAPALVLLVFGIVDMGAAWRNFQVVTHASREGARVAVLPSSSNAEAAVRTAVRTRLVQGGLDPDLATVSFHCDAGQDSECFGTGWSHGGSTEVRISYDYTFMFLGPIVAFTGGNAAAFGTIAMRTSTVMRNE